MHEISPSFNDMYCNGHLWTPVPRKCENVRERPILTTLFAINTVIASNTGSREAAPSALWKGATL